jgi:predicted TIM-barrel fold metal-dependent hydrolase
MAHPRYVESVIDVHCHWDRTMLPGCIRDLDAAGIDIGVHLWDAALPPAPYETQSAWDEFAPRVARCVVPDLSTIGQDGWAEALRRSVLRAAERGAVGIKVWKNLGLHIRDTGGKRVTVDDPRLAVLWGVAAEAGLPVAIHVGDHPDFWGPFDETNPRYEELVNHPDFHFGTDEFPALSEIHESLERMIAANPVTNFIAVHFGCFLSPGALRHMFQTYPNFHVDTAATVADMGKAESVEDVRNLFIDFPDRILFGSDLIRTDWWLMPEHMPLPDYFAEHWRFFETNDKNMPLPLPQSGDWTLTGLDLPESVLPLFYRDNALRLFKFSPTVRRMLETDS